MTAKGLFVTGTDTGVGKTEIACTILRSLRAAGLACGAYKPACSGAVLSTSGEAVWDDVIRLQSAAALSDRDDAICPQRFRAPLAPPHAAELEGRAVDEHLLVSGAARWSHVAALVVEGAGGWLSPLSQRLTNAHVAAALGYPVLIVARNRLGTINHTLLTIAAVRDRGLPIVGIILNDPDGDQPDASRNRNADFIEDFSGLPVLGEAEFGRPDRLFRRNRPCAVDWKDLILPPQPAAAALAGGLDADQSDV